jgi:hypothetical protein
MAGLFNTIFGQSPGEFLGDVAKGFFGNEYLRDYQHASKTFRTGNYGYSPKFKFLFHVYFDINEYYVGTTNLFPQDKNFGLAVKTIQLPDYTFDTHVMNQYNRKRIVQTKIKYNDVNISFHDDNANLVRKMWYAYYTYYYKDAVKKVNNNSTYDQYSEIPQANGSTFSYNKRNIYDPSLEGVDDWGYIGEGTADSNLGTAATNIGNIKVPFFNSIKIFGFNQHNFAMYELINPTITSFKHDTYDYSSSNGTMENTMTVGYETVKYYEGAVNGKAITDGTGDKNALGFGSREHYDITTSPLMRPGANQTILGQGGLISAADGVMNDLEHGNYLRAIQTAGRTANTFKNGGIKNAIMGDINNTVTDVLRGTPNRNNSFSFPSVSSSPAAASSNQQVAVISSPPAVSPPAGFA